MCLGSGLSSKANDLAPKTRKRPVDGSSKSLLVIFYDWEGIDSFSGLSL